MFVDSARCVTVQSRGRGELGTRSVALFIKRGGGGEESLAQSALGVGTIQPGVLQNLRLPQEPFKLLVYDTFNYWCLRP